MLFVFSNAVGDVDGDPYGASIVGEGACDGLADPPGGVGGEFAAAIGVEAFGGFH